MVFKIDSSLLLQELNVERLIRYSNDLQLTGQTSIWELEHEDENLLGFVDMISPSIILQIRPTTSTERLEGRIAHELTHVSLLKKGFRELRQHSEPINVEESYVDFFQQFANLLHHQVLYPILYSAGFTNSDDIDIVRKYYGDANNIEKMKAAYGSNHRFAKAWTVVCIMNDLVRLADQRHILIELISTELADALHDAEMLLEQIGPVTTVESYERSKLLIEQQYELPSFEFED